MDIVVSMIAFFALITTWFVLPASPRTVAVATHAPPAETLAPAA
jgi:hypothetical protein